MRRPNPTVERAAEIAAFLSVPRGFKDHGGGATTPAHCPQSWPIMAQHALELQRIARRLKVLAIQACNGIPYREHTGGKFLVRYRWDEADQERNAQRSKEWLYKAQHIAQIYGLGVGSQGDPRGCMLHLIARDGGCKSHFGIW